MQDERERELFFGVFEGLAQLAPGSREATLRALRAVRGLPARARVLDAGCGRGVQTHVVAEALPEARLVAVDDHVPFLRDLARAAAGRPRTARILPCAGDMAHLPFRPESLDLVWAEGAIYVVGLERGLRLWRSLVRPGGWVAVTELAWVSPDPPQEAVAFWKDEYPGMGSVEEDLASFERSRYSVAEHFRLHVGAWEAYYEPLTRRVEALRRQHPDEPAAGRVAAALEREIDVWRRHGDAFGYVFFVARRTD